MKQQIPIQRKSIEQQHNIFFISSREALYSQSKKAPTYRFN